VLVKELDTTLMIFHVHVKIVRSRLQGCATNRKKFPRT